MSILEPLRRFFNIGDAYMLEFSKTMRLFFIEDQADFAAEDTNFASPYETNTWQAAIDAAENEPTDEQRLDQLSQLTETVYNEMDLCRENFQDSKRYIKKAFPNNITIWNEFGFDDYRFIKDKQPEMIQFMKRFHSTAVKYSAQLDTPIVNFTAVKIAEIDTRKQALDNANNVQEKFKKDIPTYTQQRIQKLNAVWEITTDVGGVGKSLYSHDYAKYQHYLLPASDETETLMLSGTVTNVPAPGVEAEPIEEALITVLELALATESDSNGNYGFGILPAGTYTLTISKAGYAPQSIPGIVITEDSEVEQNFQLVADAGVTTGTISGTVTNAGALVTGATVSVNGLPGLIATTAAGIYSILNVPAGAHNVTASLGPLSPFPPQTLPVSVTAGGTVNLNFGF